MAALTEEDVTALRTLFGRMDACEARVTAVEDSANRLVAALRTEFDKLRERLEEIAVAVDALQRGFGRKAGTTLI